MTVISQFVREHVKGLLVILVLLSTIMACLVYYGKNSSLFSYVFSYNQLNTCSEGLLYRNDVMNKVNNLLKEKGDAVKGYFSLKELSGDGLNYLLLAYYEMDALIATYQTLGGLKVRQLTRQEGLNLIESLADNYGETKDYYGESSFHSHCSFMRLSNNGASREITIINAPLTNKESSEAKVLIMARSIIENEYANSSRLEHVGLLVPEELTQADLNKLKREIGKDRFYELRDIGLKN